MSSATFWGLEGYEREDLFLIVALRGAEIGLSEGLLGVMSESGDGDAGGRVFVWAWGRRLQSTLKAEHIAPELVEALPISSWRHLINSSSSTFITDSTALRMSEA